MVGLAAEYQIFERAAAANLLDYVAALNSIAPGCADAIECAGGTAAFTGPGSPLSVVKGIDRQISERDITQAESFFQRRHVSRVTFELAPWVAVSSAPLLRSRGYFESGVESVATCRIPADSPVTETAASGLRTCVLDAGAWGEVFRDVCEIPQFEWWDRLSRAAALLPGAVNLAVPGEGGGWLACAQLAPLGNIAIFGNDNTLVGARRRGIQKMLIHERFQRAAVLGIPVAIAEVEPGSVSEANYIKCGFYVAYARTHYSRELD
jgi:hypothetical protein